jgi:hypothetical protein
MHAFILCCYVLLYQQILSYHESLLVNDVVKFAFFLLHDVLFAVIVIVVIIILVLSFIFSCTFFKFFFLLLLLHIKLI